MEQNAIQWLGAPSCLRGSFAFYKSVSSRAQAGAPAQVWRLGEFYFVRCGPQEPVCIAEVTLLWEDQTQRHLLASSRLYFLPEDTPQGRTGEHGEDEVLAVSKKIVVRVEDLVKWTCPEPPGWMEKNQNSNGLHKPTHTTGATELQQDKPEGVVPVEQQSVTVLSYPQYCRFRSLQKRVQERAGSASLQDPHLLALGGIRAAQSNTQVLYCRDTFNHPTLDSNSSVLTQLGCSSLSLKGRPRKRRGRDGKALEQQNLNQSGSWIERMKENVMGSVEMHWEGGWLPHPEEQLFLDQLCHFMEHRGSPISKVPNLGFKKIDLFLMYSVVKRLGGYERVTSQRHWKTVYNELGGSPGSTSAATCTRRHYEKLMLPYEQHLKGGSPELTKPHLPCNIRKTMKGRGAVAAQKRNEVPAQAVTPEVVVVRKRGRPPGKRNAKVMAKASLRRPSLQTKPGSDQGAPQAASFQPVFQELNLSNQEMNPLAPGLSPNSPLLPHQPKVERDVKVENMESPSPSILPSLSRLQAGGSLGGFSPTKGLCPLDLFRTRLGLGGVDSPGLTPPDPTAPQTSALLLQPKAETPESAEPDGELQHQCSGCRAEDVSQSGGLREGRASRPPLPPLRILPLDIDCSLQVRQLMRTRFGSVHMSSFTKRLSEVLAQDLSKACPPGHLPPAPQEQVLPLNLSKRHTAKRPADDTEARDMSLWQHNGDTQLKRMKAEPEDLSLPLKRNGGPASVVVTPEEPADLSSPCRARAFLKDWSDPVAATPDNTFASRKPGPDATSDGHSSGCVPSVLESANDVRDLMTEVVNSNKVAHCRTDAEKTQESKDPEPCSDGDLCDQLAPVDNVKMECDVVPSLRELPSSLLPQSPQSC